jgi:hypothetical protein
MLMAVPTYIRLDRKSLPGTYTLAYSIGPFVSYEENRVF